MSAAEEGNLDILKWLRSQNPPCPWDEEVNVKAIEKGHTRVLKWACRQPDPPPLGQRTAHALSKAGMHTENPSTNPWSGLIFGLD